MRTPNLRLTHSGTCLLLALIASACSTSSPTDADINAAQTDDEYWQTRYEQQRHEFYCLTRHVWLFPGGWTFPRAEMFRKGLSLWRVFEEACVSKVKTERKI